MPTCEHSEDNSLISISYDVQEPGTTNRIKQSPTYKHDNHNNNAQNVLSAEPRNSFNRIFPRLNLISTGY